jgi:ABC-2 type transport system ATP-binding protein
VIAEGTPTELKASVGAGSLRVRVRDPHQRQEAQRVLADAVSAPVLLESDPAVVSTHAEDTDEVTRAIGRLSEVGIGVAEFAYGQPSLDEVFLALTGHPAEDTTPQEDAA